MKRIVLSLLIVTLFVLGMGLVSAGKEVDFSLDNTYAAYNNVDITFIDVSKNDLSCVFKIGDKIEVIKEGHTFDHEYFSLWVKDVYALRTVDSDGDICQVIVSEPRFTNKVELKNSLRNPEEVDIVSDTNRVDDNEPESKEEVDEEDEQLEEPETQNETSINQSDSQVDVDSQEIQEEDKTVKKAGFFTRLFRWLGGLFS